MCTCRDRAVLSFMLSQHVIERLALPFGGREATLQVLPKKFDSDALVGSLIVQPCPKHVHVVGHKHIGWAE
jgi:hypothetical protein